VPVPEEADGFDMNTNNGDPELTFYTIDNDERHLHGVALPPGTWQIVCTTKDVTEEVAHEIVETQGEWNGRKIYKCYDKSDLWVYNSVISFRSLLRSLNLNGHYLILKKL